VDESAKYFPPNISTLMPSLAGMIEILDDVSAPEPPPPHIPSHLFDYKNVFTLDKKNSIP